MTKINDKCLLITGTIKPMNVPNLVRNNKEVREQDYYKAIEKWITLGIPIVFCENSNTLSKRIQELLNQSNVNNEYLTFSTQKSSLGKGHGEAEIITFAHQNSNILHSYSSIIKVTGRYFVGNSREIIMNSSVNNEAIIESDLTRNLTWADSRFFIYNHEFYDLFLSRFFDDIDESKKIYFEHILSRAIHLAISKGERWNFLFDSPVYVGVYGTDNTNYKNNILFRTKKKIWHKYKKYTFKKMV